MTEKKNDNKPQNNQESANVFNDSMPSRRIRTPQRDNVFNQSDIKGINENIEQIMQRTATPPNPDESGTKD